MALFILILSGEMENWGGDHVNVTWPLKALKGNAHTHAFAHEENKSFP